MKVEHDRYLNLLEKKIVHHLRIGLLVFVQKLRVILCSRNYSNDRNTFSQKQTNITLCIKDNISKQFWLKNYN